MKSKLIRQTDKGVSYDALVFVCPGCKAGGPEGYDGIHILPVNAENLGLAKPSWTFNGDLELPTLSPSILSTGYSRCHSFLEAGVFNFLTDSDHSLSGQHVPIPDLPDWAAKLS